MNHNGVPMAIHDTLDTNGAALQRLYAVRPQWRAVRTAREAVGLPDKTLLHAGPPYANPREPAPVILSSAVLCCLYEGWAGSEAEAEQLIAGGEVTLASAQSYNVVTPLAAVISPSTMLVDVVDANDASRHAFSLLGSGAGPQIRFGSRDPAIIARIRWRDTALAATLSAVLSEGPVDLLPLAKIGLADGDDLHARTTSATAALRTLLEARQRAHEIDEADRAATFAMLQQTPLFFLTLWMAACHLMMSAAGDTPSNTGASGAASSLVVALAGNGRDVGIRLSGAPSRWLTLAADAPAGPRIDPTSLATAASLTGDSGVIDAAGFGAHALSSAPEPATAFGPWLPPGWQQAQPALLAGAHPAFDGRPVALDAKRVGANGTAPLAAIAMIDAEGRRGLLGRGIYAAPVDLFKETS